MVCEGSEAPVTGPARPLGADLFSLSSPVRRVLYPDRKGAKIAPVRQICAWRGRQGDRPWEGVNATSQQAFEDSPVDKENLKQASP
jgi:hypothetical protein